jgi:hypothetical protein
VTENREVEVVMRRGVCLSVCCLLSVSGALRAEGPRLTLTDPKLPLWQFRAMDRRVVVVTLEGAWKGKPLEEASYEITLRFPDGTTTTHRPVHDELFRAGEARVLLQEYQLVRHGASHGGKIQVWVTQRRSRTAAPEAISNGVELSWPLGRKISASPPRTKFTPAAPIDAFPAPDK